MTRMTKNEHLFAAARAKLGRDASHVKAIKLADTYAAAPETAAERDRLREVNAELLEACKAVVRWLGEPEFETSDGAHPAFRKALLSCRAAIATATTDDA
jgi:hypothetical protein